MVRGITAKTDGITWLPWQQHKNDNMVFPKFVGLACVQSLPDFVWGEGVVLHRQIAAWLTANSGAEVEGSKQIVVKNF